jgi:uncharacterized radical SAM superfamily protein
MAIIERVPEIDAPEEETSRVRATEESRTRALKILFVNPPSPDKFVYIRDINRSGRRSRERTIWPQTSLAMLASVFPTDNCMIIDCIAEELSYKDLYEEMQDFKPDWVVFNPVSTTVTHDMIVAHYGKALGAKTVAISPHTKALKEESYERYRSLDHAVDYAKGGLEPEENLRQLVKGDAETRFRFETLPPARQDLLPIQRYSLPFIGRGYTFVVTSRGCPWKCIYCRQPVMNESISRYRPVKTVIEEIRKYELKNIAFHADTATMNRQWIMEFCEAVKSLPFKIRIVTNSRVDTVDLEMLRAMKQAGFWMVCFGIESGNDEVLEANKKEATVEQARTAVKLAKKAGLQVWGYFMLGMYKDTKATMHETVKLSLSLPLDIVNYAISAPYPGTEWGKIAEGNKWLVDDRWESFDQNYSAQVEQPECPRHLIKKIQRYAYLRWYGSWRGVLFALKGLRPRYIGYFFKTIGDHLK